MYLKINKNKQTIQYFYAQLKLKPVIGVMDYVEISFEDEIISDVIDF